jgi:hypothetical protein
MNGNAPDQARDQPSTTTDLLFALSLALGVAGSLALLDLFPPLLWIWPMGLGAAAAVLAVIGWMRQSPTPWWSVFAIIASVVSLYAGYLAYSDFEDAANQTRDALSRF